MNKLKQISLLFLLLLSGISIELNSQNNQGTFTYQVFENKNKTFGYKIFRDGKAMINQESMPAVPGNSGFHKKQQAEKMATFVIQKINKGVMPPTVSVTEVDSIKALVK